MILIIDNYDSFTYNLVQYVGSINKHLQVIKNNDLNINQIKKMNLSHIIISPGPGHPENTGVCLEVIEQISPIIPTLGICLGHQAIAFHYNAAIINSHEIVHGKTSLIKHDNKSLIFNKIPNNFSATRYHSLCVDREFINNDINITSWSEDGEIMSLEHKKYPIYGIQFHPESILTEHGIQIIKNFINIIV
jgi:anthranilate synthase/aminodeoxychorismate synthase-like glutamine amidotransferase